MGSCGSKQSKSVNRIREPSTYYQGEYGMIEVRRQHFSIRQLVQNMQQCYPELAINKEEIYSWTIDEIFADKALLEQTLATVIEIVMQIFESASLHIREEENKLYFKVQSDIDDTKKEQMAQLFKDKKPLPQIVTIVKNLAALNYGNQSVFFSVEHETLGTRIEFPICLLPDSENTQNILLSDLSGVIKNRFLSIEDTINNNNKRQNGKILRTISPDSKHKHSLFYSCLSNDNRYLMIFKGYQDPKKKQENIIIYLEYYDMIDEKIITRRHFTPKNGYVPKFCEGGIINIMSKIGKIATPEQIVDISFSQNQQIGATISSQENSKLIFLAKGPELKRNESSFNPKIQSISTTGQDNMICYLSNNSIVMDEIVIQNQGSSIGEVKLETTIDVAAPRKHKASYISMATFPKCYVGYEDGLVELINLKTNKTEGKVSLPLPMSGLINFANGKYIAAPSANQVFVTTIEGKDAARKIEFQDRVNRVSASNNGKYIVACLANGDVQVALSGVQ